MEGKKEFEIANGIISRIKKLKSSGASPISLAKGLNEVYSDFRAEMTVNGFNEDTMESTWNHIKERCNLMYW